MSNKYKIILFMRAKQTILEIHYAYVSNLYFNDKDIERIRMWPKWKCFWVWHRIKYAVFHQGLYGLSRRTCAMCVACFYRCHQCEFAMNHDRCSSDFGDFARLNKRIPEDKLNSILSNKYYRNIIESIENRTYTRLVDRDSIL